MKANAAVQILVMLGAYCPRVKITDPVLFHHQQNAAKRRTRPMVGRGNYGRNIRALFDSNRKPAV